MAVPWTGSLELSNSGSVLPPPANWTKDVRNILRIKRMFHLCDALGAAPSVVGERLWMVLLGDLYGEPAENIPVAEVKADRPPFALKVVGAHQADKFMEMVIEQQAFPFLLTFDRAKELVTQSGRDPLECLQLGLEEIKLRWFLHVRIWQTNHPRATWDSKSLI